MQRWWPVSAQLPLKLCQASPTQVLIVLSLIAYKRSFLATTEPPPPSGAPLGPALHTASPSLCLDCSQCLLTFQSPLLSVRLGQSFLLSTGLSSSVSFKGVSWLLVQCGLAILLSCLWFNFSHLVLPSSLEHWDATLHSQLSSSPSLPPPLPPLPPLPSPDRDREAERRTKRVHSMEILPVHWGPGLNAGGVRAKQQHHPSELFRQQSVCHLEMNFLSFTSGVNSHNLKTLIIVIKDITSFAIKKP